MNEPRTWQCQVNIYPRKHVLFCIAYVHGPWWKHCVSPRALEDLTTAAVGCPLGPGNASLIVASYYKHGIRRTVTADRLATALLHLNRLDTQGAHTQPCWCGRCCLLASGAHAAPTDARRRTTSRPPCTQTSDSQSILVRAVSSAFAPLLDDANTASSSSQHGHVLQRYAGTTRPAQ